MIRLVSVFLWDFIVLLLLLDVKEIRGKVKRYLEYVLLGIY